MGFRADKDNKNNREKKTWVNAAYCSQWRGLEETLTAAYKMRKSHKGLGMCVSQLVTS